VEKLKNNMTKQQDTLNEKSQSHLLNTWLSSYHKQWNCLKLVKRRQRCPLKSHQFKLGTSNEPNLRDKFWKRENNVRNLKRKK
jgi:hypothetical protein